VYAYLRFGLLCGLLFRRGGLGGGGLVAGRFTAHSLLQAGHEHGLEALGVQAPGLELLLEGRHGHLRG